MEPEQWMFLQRHEHKDTLVSTCEEFFERNTFVDCTIAAEGQYLKVHKMILSACSPYFEILLNDNRDEHPVIILTDVKFRSLKSIVEYMYRGEAIVLSTEMKEFFEAADTLQIKGIEKQGEGDTQNQPTEDLRDREETHSPLPCSVLQIIYEEKDNWADSDLPSTLTETVQESFVTQTTHVLFSEGDAGKNILQKVQKSVASDAHMAKEATAAVGVEDAESFVRNLTSLGFSVIGLSDKTEQLAQEDLEEGPTASQETGNSFGGGTDESRARFDTVGETTRECMSRTLGSEQGRTPTECAGVKPTTRIGHKTLLKRQGSQVDDEDGASSSKTAKKTLPPRCLYCNKSFSSRFYLKIHERLHTKHESFSCPECPMKFLSKAGLRRHMLTHTGHKPFACQKCSERFPRKNDLQKHMLNHTRRKPYKCAVCLESFSRSDHLKRHMSTHMGLRPYKCEECLKAFARKDKLKGHMAIHAKHKTQSCPV